MSQCSSKYKGVDFNDRSKYDSYNAINPDFGYITECGEDCKSGYTEIDTFRAKNKINGINYPLCGWAWEWRKVCRKNRKWLGKTTALDSKGRIITEKQKIAGITVDMPKLIDANTIDRKRKCCSGALSGINECHPDYCPGSPECVNVMKSYCDNNTNFFKPECQEFLKSLENTGYKGIIDTLGNKICPKFKNSSDNRKKKICGCFNVDAANIPKIKEDPTLRGMAMCLSENCGQSNPDALRPTVLGDCPINSVVCKNESNRLALIESDIGLKASIENECGITVGGNGNSNSTSTSTSTSTSSSRGSTSREGSSSRSTSFDVEGGNALYWTLGIGGVFFLLIILALVMFLIL